MHEVYLDQGPDSTLKFTNFSNVQDEVPTKVASNGLKKKFGIFLKHCSHKTYPHFLHWKGRENELKFAQEVR
jgi:hypothetical protein